MKHIYLPILGLAGTLLIACQGPSQIPATKVVNDYCDLASPILLLKSELPNLSQESKRQIWAHNEIWDRVCNQKQNESSRQG